jgi:hypothetical protein
LWPSIFSNLYEIFKNSFYHVSKEKLSAQRQKRKKPLLGRPISHVQTLFPAAVLLIQSRRFYIHRRQQEDAAMRLWRDRHLSKKA